MYIPASGKQFFSFLLLDRLERSGQVFVQGLRYLPTAGKNLNVLCYILVAKLNIQSGDISGHEAYNLSILKWQEPVLYLVGPTLIYDKCQEQGSEHSKKHYF
jgi:hypothetical protein